jgi:hypothetical protein
MAQRAARPTMKGYAGYQVWAWGTQAGQAARVRVGIGKPGEAGRCRMGTMWCGSTWMERDGNEVVSGAENVLGAAGVD